MTEQGWWKLTMTRTYLEYYFALVLEAAGISSRPNVKDKGGHSNKECCIKRRSSLILNPWCVWEHLRSQYSVINLWAREEGMSSSRCCPLRVEETHPNKQTNKVTNKPKNLLSELSLEAMQAIGSFEMKNISMPTWIGWDVFVFSAQMENLWSWHCPSLCCFTAERGSTCQALCTSLCWCQQLFQQSPKRAPSCCESPWLPHSQATEHFRGPLSRCKSQDEIISD